MSFGLRRGEFVVVRGTIGSGKTTLLRALLGLAWQTAEPGGARPEAFAVTRACASTSLWPDTSRTVSAPRQGVRVPAPSERTTASPCRVSPGR